MRAAPVAALASAVAGAAAQPLPSGQSTHTLTHGGRSRTFIVNNPGGDSAAGLVLVFHGFTQTASNICSMAGVSSWTRSSGYIGVCPQGVANSWNAGGCCGTAQLTGVDDVGFARAIVSYVSGKASFDDGNVFATGFSNGGMISYRLGCQASDVFTGIAPVAGRNYGGILGGFTCSPGQPRSVIHWHGTTDPLQYYATAYSAYNRYALSTLGCGSLYWPVYSNPLYFGMTCNQRTTCPSGRRAAFCGSTLAHFWPTNALPRSIDFLTGRPMLAANATDDEPFDNATDAEWAKYL